MSTDTATVAEAPAGAGWTAITRRMIGDRRKSLFWWTFGVTVLVAIMAATYPSIRDTGDALDDYVASLPRGCGRRSAWRAPALPAPRATSPASCTPTCTRS